MDNTLKKPDAVLVGNTIYYSTEYVLQQKADAFTAGTKEMDVILHRYITKSEELQAWKDQSIKMWLPIFEYMQGHKDLNLGESISEAVLFFIKQRDAVERQHPGILQSLNDDSI